jgi:hypothetical protein
MLRGFQTRNSNKRGMVGLLAATSKQRRSKKQEAKESVEMDTFADTTRDSMMVDDSSQANPWE